MGTGPTWIILSLLNSYAAYRTGTRKEAYHVCGDDLIGIFTKTQKDQYIRTMEEDLQMVVNTRKSFYGPRGVFCERIVHDDTIRVTDRSHPRFNLHRLNSPKTRVTRAHAKELGLRWEAASFQGQVRDCQCRLSFMGIHETECFVYAPYPPPEVFTGHRASAKDVGHLSALTASKYIARVSRDRAAIVDTLRAFTARPSLSNLVSDRLAPRFIRGGKAKFGGRGSGAPELGSLTAYARMGAFGVKLPKVPKNSLKRVLESPEWQSKVPSTRVVDFITKEDAIIELRSAQRVRSILQTGTCDEAEPPTLKGWRQRDRLGRKFDRLGKDGLLNAVADSEYPLSIRKHVRQLLRRTGKSVPRRIRLRISNALEHKKRVEWAPLIEVREIIRAESGLQWWDPQPSLPVSWRGKSGANN